jgi:hypothetical protein
MRYSTTTWKLSTDAIMNSGVVLICYFVLSEKTNAEKIEAKSEAHSGAPPCVSYWHQTQQPSEKLFK